jgi:3-oxoacyl-[acyl-carrier-protein] synthase-1
MTTSVDIVATGARTPLGLRAAASAAAHRAGISAVGEHPFMIDRLGDAMSGALDSMLDPSLTGPRRLVALAETALREAAETIAAGRRPRIPVFLGLPELRPGFTVSDADEVRIGIQQIEDLPIDILEIAVLPEGHAAGLKALAMATERIQQGVAEACLVGGVDSYFQAETLEWLDENRQLVSAGARSAFVPGEGAGFCLVMSDQARARVGLGALAHVSTVALGRESQLIKTSDICLGTGLTAVVQRAVGGLTLPAETINEVICDVNGERYRGEEWGFVCLRLPEYFDDPAAYWSPADCWGDVGAASGPLFAMLACHAAERGYAKGSRTLLWASSEGGLRSAVVVNTVDKD